MFQSRQTISFGALFVWGLLHSVFNTLNAYICVRPFARAHGEVCASCREPHKEASSLVTGPCQATTSTSGHLDHQGSSQKSILFGAQTFETYVILCHYADFSYRPFGRNQFVIDCHQCQFGQNMLKIGRRAHVSESLGQSQQPLVIRFELLKQFLLSDEMCLSCITPSTGHIHSPSRATPHRASRHRAPS